MAQLFFKYSILFFLLWLSIIFWVLDISQQNAPAPSQQLTDTGFAECKLPCWGGITVGETHRNEVESRLPNTVPNLHTLSTQGQNGQVGQRPITNILVNTIDDEVFYGTIGYSSDGIVTGLYLNHQLSFQHLMMDLDAPTCLIPANINQVQGFEVIWQRSNVEIITILTTTSDKTADFMNSETFDLKIDKNRSRCDTPISYQWQGFAPLWYYQN